MYNVLAYEHWISFPTDTDALVPIKMGVIFASVLVMISLRYHNLSSVINTIQINGVSHCNMRSKGILVQSSCTVFLLYILG